MRLYHFSFVLFCFTSLLSLAASSPSPVSSEAQLFFQEGMRLKDQRDLTKAEELIKKAIELDPNNAEFHFELANIYALRHDLVGQEPHENAPDDAMLAACAMELEQSIVLKRDFIPAIYNLGIVHKKRGEYERAREQFRRVLQLDSNQASAYLQIAGTYEAQGFFDDARDVYRKAKQIDFGNPAIDVALQELDESEKKFAESHRTSDLTERLMNTRFPYTQNGHAAQYASQSQDQGRDPRQAVPMLGMWLVQEFMKRRAAEKTS